MIIKNRFGTYSSHINAVSPDTSTFWRFLGWCCSVDVQDGVKLGLCSVRCCYLSFKQEKFIQQQQNLVGLQQFDEIAGWDLLWYWLSDMRNWQKLSSCNAWKYLICPFHLHHLLILSLVPKHKENSHHLQLIKGRFFDNCKNGG